MVVITFFGYKVETVDGMMPEVVRILDLGHKVYSVNVVKELRLYDEKGQHFIGFGKMIVVPGFAEISGDPSRLNALSKALEVPVSTSLAKVRLAIGDNLF